MMDASRLAILQKYGLSAESLIQKGMEAEVYALGAETVLKLFPGTMTAARLATLQQFYAALSPAVLSYHLPFIQSVAVEGDICVSIELRQPGKPMSMLLPTLAKTQVDRMMRTYLNAALELAALPIPPVFDRYTLFESGDSSLRTDEDWHQFLTGRLVQKLAQLRNALGRDVANLEAKRQRLFACLAQPYGGACQLIHGDFYPGNLLVDARRQVTALLDFGLMTMVGDRLFDLATGWVFFDMYDELKANLRARYLAMLLETLGEQVRGRLYRYVLVYSILSANTYSPTCTDGHYRWCVVNLNNHEYWNGME